MPGEIPSTDQKWKRMFCALLRLIVRDERLQKLPPQPTLIFSQELDATVCAQIQWDPVVITISTGFIAEIRTELLNYGEALMKLASEPGRRNPRSEYVLRAVEELTLSFILLHEIFH